MNVYVFSAMLRKTYGSEKQPCQHDGRMLERSLFGPKPTLELIGTVHAHEGQVNGVSTNEDGSIGASVGADGKASAKKFNAIVFYRPRQ